MPSKPSISKGRPLPFFGIGRGYANLFSLSAHNRIVRVCNAILGLKTVDGQTTKFELSDTNSLLTIGQQQASSSAVELPWQIYKAPATGADTDWRTVRVSAGSMWYVSISQEELDSVSAPNYDANYNNSTGHDTDIVITAGEIWSIWASIDGSGAYSAPIGYGLTPPAGWLEYPQRQSIDYYPIKTDGKGYALIGIVDATDTTGKTLVIGQIVFDNIHVPFKGEKTMTYFHGGWGAMSYYPYGAMLAVAGQFYVRNGIANGESGGDPTGGNDWTPVP